MHIAQCVSTHANRQADDCIIYFNVADSKLVHSLRVTSLRFESRHQQFLTTGNMEANTHKCYTHEQEYQVDYSTRNYLYLYSIYNGKGKGKPVPLEDWSGPSVPGS